MNNSCIMLATYLELPTSLGIIFPEHELANENGLIFDHHITISYAKGIQIPKDEVLGCIRKYLGFTQYTNFTDFLKDDFDSGRPVGEDFLLSTFTGGDSDYVILKLKKDTPLFKTLSIINKGFEKDFDIVSDFPTYVPHISLAELQKGCAKKYVKDKGLHSILSEAYYRPEDFVYSYGPADDYTQYNITTFHAVSRFFRIENYKKQWEELNKEGVN